MIGIGIGPTFQSGIRNDLLPQFLREQIEGLRDESTPNGRQSAAPLKVVGVDPLPAGITLSGDTITMSGTDAVLENWELGGYRVDVNGTGQVVRNNIWTSPEVISSALYPIYVSPLAEDAVIEYNTIDGYDGYGGPATMINMPTSGDGALAFGAVNTTIRFNRFLSPNSDVIKASGNGTLIEWNYYGPLTNYPVGTVAWSAGTTYSAGDFVLYQDVYLFRSLVDSNTGNEPPNSKTDTAEWGNLDPHGDANTITASNGAGVTIRRNMIDWGDEIVRAVGTTQAVRAVRNTGANVLVGIVNFVENLIPDGYPGAYPIATGFIRPHFTTTVYAEGGLCEVDGVYYVSLQDGNQNNPPLTSPAWWEVTTDINAPGPVNFSDNWISAGSGGLYFHPSTNDAIDVWNNNRDADTDALIDAPVLRVQNAVIVGASMGQSQRERTLTNASAATSVIPKATLVAEDVLTVYTDPHGTGADINNPDISKTVVTQASVDAGLVNPAMAAMSDFLSFRLPGRQFAMVDLAVPGTGFADTMDDEVTDRVHADMQAMIDYVGNDGLAINHLFVNWMGNDAAEAKTYDVSFMPIFTGQYIDGTPVVLGEANTASVRGNDIDHFVYDLNVPASSLGNGTFRRNTTTLNFVGWDTFNPRSEGDPEMYNYTDAVGGNGGYSEQVDAPARSKVAALLADPRMDDMRGWYGPSSHIVRMTQAGTGTGGSDLATHPDYREADGLILSGWPLTLAFARQAGDTAIRKFIVHEHSRDDDGAWARLRVTDQDGNALAATDVLTSLRSLRSLAEPDPKPPHWQPIIGVEITRGGVRRPVWNLDAPVEYEDAWRGTVTADGADILVVPLERFENGDSLDLLRGDASAVLLEPRDKDARLYLDMPAVHVPALYDSNATYPLEVTPVDPQPTTQVLMGMSVVGETAWDITAGDGQATINSHPSPPNAPSVTAGDGEAILETT